MTRFPNIELKGDKKEAARWIRRGQSAMKSLLGIQGKMDVPITKRTIEFNERVTCTVSVHGLVQIIEIYAAPIGEVSEEEEEEVVEEEYFKCFPGFMVYRDHNGYKWNPDAEPPAYEHVSDDGEVISHNGTKWSKADTDYKQGGRMAWYHLKDNIGKYFRGGEYKRCNLISWNGLPWGTMGWGYDSVDSQYFYFHGARYSAGSSTTFVIGACVLPGSTSEGKDYFHVLVANNWAYANPYFSIFHGWSYTLKRAPVKLPPESTVLSWEVLKTWEDYDGIDHPLEWSSTIGSSGGACSAPNCGAYIDAKGIASMTVTETIGQAYVDEPGPGYRTGNAVSGGLYGSPMPFYPSGWGDQTIWNQNGRYRATISFKLDMRDGKITEQIDETRAGVQSWQYRHARHVSDKPVLGLGVLPTSHVYCGPEGGSGSEKSDLVDFTKPADNGRYKKYAQQGHHQQRGTPAAGSTTEETYGGKEVMIAIAGGSDALYSYHMKMSNYRNDGTGTGSSTRHKWTKSNANPDGFDALPVWSWSTSRGGTVQDFKGEFIVKKDGSEHFKLALHENDIDTGGTHGTTLTWAVQPSVFAGASSPFYGWGSVNEYKTVTIRGNTATAFTTQRAILFYHPMMNKALFTERQVYTTRPAQGDTDVTGTVWLKWGDQNNAETLGQWTGLVGSGGSIDTLHFMLQSAWWDGGTNITGANHCDGEANPGATMDSEAWGINGRFAFWAQDNFCSTGTGYQPYWRPGHNIGNEGGGLGPKPLNAFINPLEIHQVERFDSDEGTTTTMYDRLCYAVHHESPVSGDEPAYIFYLPKPVMTSLTPGNMVTGDFSGTNPGPFSINSEFNEETPEYWFFSNCITLDKLKKTANRDTDYPVDFGVI